jgi:hypothetical protein
MVVGKSRISTASRLARLLQAPQFAHPPFEKAPRRLLAREAERQLD